MYDFANYSFFFLFLDSTTIQCRTLILNGRLQASAVFLTLFPVLILIFNISSYPAVYKYHNSMYRILFRVLPRFLSMIYRYLFISS